MPSAEGCGAMYCPKAVQKAWRSCDACSLVYMSAKIRKETDTSNKTPAARILFGTNHLSFNPKKEAPLCLRPAIRFYQV